MDTGADLSAASDDFVDARNHVDEEFNNKINLDANVSFGNDLSDGFITRRITAPVTQSTPVRRSEPKTSTDTLPRPSRSNATGPGLRPVILNTAVENINQASASTVKPTISATITALFQDVKNTGSVDLEQLERNVLATLAKEEEQWAAKMSQAAAQKTANDALHALVQQYDESENYYYDAILELANQNKENFGGRKAKSFSHQDEQLKGQFEKAKKERDALAEEFATLENNYGDLFRRYELLRQNSQSLKENEAKLKREAELLAEKNGKLVQKLSTASEAATETLTKANEEIDRLTAARESDNIALRMKVKQYASQMATLESTIQAKDLELEELQQICNELLQKADVEENDEF